MKEYVNNNVRIRTIKRISNETDRRDDRGYRCGLFGVALLQALRDMPNVETHLVMSKWAKTTIELETPYSAHDVAALADFSHNPADQAAIISSGSFRTDGMIVIPCSMKTLAGIRAGYADGLVGRAADVVLKEGRKLVLVPREMPLSTIHLENMLALSRMGVAMGAADACLL
ncbi:4-hydroxybenzoate decarboxylase subunit B [Escherichia coli]|uniref:4-hydroxybenzoate decarboxylase subunit B n=1 Tax=Escherichia coli TaxID=562 RepID=A0A376KN36_ECOLX|nr:4-hydroxybenzoate decarboxylase subunit B [Escherichia coli]